MPTRRDVILYLGQRGEPVTRDEMARRFGLGVTSYELDQACGYIGVQTHGPWVWLTRRAREEAAGLSVPCQPYWSVLVERRQVWLFSPVGPRLLGPFDVDAVEVLAVLLEHAGRDAARAIQVASDLRSARVDLERGTRRDELRRVRDYGLEPDPLTEPIRVRVAE